MDGITRIKNFIVMKLKFILVKKLILLLTLMTVITVTYSQKRFNLTFLASPQVSWLKSDSKEIKGGESFLGFGYGVEGDIFLGSDNYAIMTGMTVSTAGGSLTYIQSIPFSGKTLPVGTKVDYYLTNLEFPLVLKMRTREFGRVRYFAQFGVTNWLNIKAKATSSDRSFQKEKISDVIRTFNIGLNVGAGLEYDIGHGNALTGGIVYSNGLTDATNIKGTTDDATTLKILRFRLGFTF